MTMSYAYGIARAPSLLLSQGSLSRLTQTNLEMYRLTGQLATGMAILRPSDDAVKAAAISALDSRLERSDQRMSNLIYASDSLDTLDDALGEATDLLNDAKSMALEQVNTGTTAEERANQALVVQSLLDTMERIANRESIVGYIFGGSRPGKQPVEGFHGAYRFVGERGGLTTDMGMLRGVPITLGANNVIGAMSARVEGAVDLDPELRDDTRISDLAGARGLGVTLGSIEANFNGEENFSINLAGADTIGDVIDAIEAAVRAYENENDVTVLGPGGVSIDGRSISIDIPEGELTFEDLPGGITGQDLGLVTRPSAGFDTGRVTTDDLRPSVAWNTAVEALQALDAPLGSIRISNNGSSAVVDLSEAETLADVRALIESTNLGLRVEINEDGTGLNVVSEVAGGRDAGLSIEEVDGTTAEALGIRSMTEATELSVFNDGRGVDIVDGVIDPETGLYDTRRNVDFVITLGDGFEIPIDLRPEDIGTVGDVIEAINQQAADALSAAGRDESELVASLHPTSNGITLTQDGGISGAVVVRSDNNSTAANQIGLLDGEWSDSAGQLVGQDRATARPDNVFAHLIDLRDALSSNDTSGISLAAEKLDEALSRIVENRALVAGYARRVSDESSREEDRQVLDTQMRSNLRDLDYAAAATRYTQLQTQLQAGLQTAAQLSRLSLLDFLG
ncbi:MAG: hypothetical protein DYG94_04870 [Leptolyngbya sp. PLA3]|nr:MAG: hypothetical protein EDM82_04020 [Cyanobacteria bacterium CYA]MCE7968065.1 hypothetical protein [Leptolyngbya sp. PL-A3]